MCPFHFSILCTVSGLELVHNEIKKILKAHSDIYANAVTKNISKRFQSLQKWKLEIILWNVEVFFFQIFVALSEYINFIKMRLPKDFGPILRAMACMKDKSLKKTIKENNKSSRHTPLLSSFESTPRRDYWLSRFHQSKPGDFV
jgi:hypothetical protein